MEVVEKIIAIFYSLVILGGALCLRRVTGTWLFPGCLFSMFWFFYTFFPLVVLFEVPVNPNSIAFITTAVLLFSSTFLLFDWRKAFLENLNKPQPAEVFNSPFLRLTLVSAILISLFGSVMHLFAQGFGLMDVFNNPVLVASKFADARYNDTLAYTPFGPISLLFSNISVIVGGLIFGSVQASKNKKILFAFLPSVIILLTQSSKGLFFQSVFLFLGSILVTKLYANELKIFSFKIILRVIIIVSIFLVLIAVSFLSRGLKDVDDFGVLLDNFRILFATYFFTHIYGFSDWFTAFTGGRAAFNYDTSHYYFGFYTFTAIFEFFGSNKVTSQGVYDEFFMYKDLLESNIYTIFRGMIMDFGIIGSLIFMLVNGFFLHLVFYVFLRRNRPVFTVVMVIFMVEYFYISFIISLLTWSIIPLTFLVCYLILKFNNYNFVLKPTVQK
ncbi:O-antigen polymerase [Pedobacter psychroterrae]|uniref:Oligosaccharide repeat unit polymerase n=1 Tax=Pedobacter psychroterrae TaxID=2530453 RepID=A0A4R0NRR1_9SPHI|nr:O-antigen polymerase [Pedobacter psychroterrae]TCD02748.1 oligosaccharide repeat unit polymerase [Pedobacter psychroterrae]